MNINAGNPSLKNLIFRDVKEKKRPSFASVFEKLNSQTSTMNRKTPLNNVLTNEQLFRFYVKDVMPQLDYSNETFGENNANGLSNDLIRKLLNKDDAMTKDNVSTLKGRVNYQPNQMGDGSVNPVLQYNPPPSLPTPPSSTFSLSGRSTPAYSEDFEPNWDTASSIAENIDLEDYEDNMDANLELQLLLAPTPKPDDFDKAMKLIQTDNDLRGKFEEISVDNKYGKGAFEWVQNQVIKDPQMRSLKPEQVLNFYFELDDKDTLQDIDPSLDAFLRGEREFVFKNDEDGAVQKKQREGGVMTVSRTLPQSVKDSRRAENLNKMKNWMVDTGARAKMIETKGAITKTAEGTRQEFTYTYHPPIQPIRKTGITDKERENAEKAEKAREYQREYRRKKKEEREKEKNAPAARGAPKKK